MIESTEFSPRVGDDVVARHDVLAEVARSRPGPPLRWELVEAGARGKLIGWRERGGEEPRACVAMWAHHLGKTYDQDDVFAATGLDPALGRGAYTPELVRAVKQLGFAPPNVYTLVDAAHPQPAIERELGKLHADLARGIASI